MDMYCCDTCGYIYDPEEGESETNTLPGVAFEKLGSDWRCPACQAGKDEFSVIGPYDSDYEFETDYSNYAEDLEF